MPLCCRSCEKWEFHFLDQAFITHTVPVLQIFHSCYWSMERELCLEDLDSPDNATVFAVIVIVMLTSYPLWDVYCWILFC